MKSSELEVLRQVRLDGIVFVLDYLQIQFDTVLATFLKYPDVTVRDQTYEYGDQDYRNALCEFISEVVSTVDYEEDVSFCLNFDNGKIHISLEPDQYTSPEIVVIDVAGEKSIVI